MKNVRTRFAPSPTGFLHIGGLRSALYCYVWAKKHKGSFILRIEDTDRARLVKGAVKQQINSLNWAHLSPDEGVVGVNNKVIQKGKLGPYIQSERLEIYAKHAAELLKKNAAYKCYCSPERLTEMRDVQRAAKQTPKYDRTCYNLSKEEKKGKEEEGLESVIRFFVPDGQPVTWEDEIFETMKFDREQVDDFVMIKADGFPTYNFANVVDDHLMKISHVIRGQEFLSSTPKHLLVYDAFGWDKPAMAHVPWILGKNKQKMSKRDGDVSVDDFINKGFLPEALINFIALLGWNPKQDEEIFSLDEMIKKFELSDIQKSGAVFDLEKLEWMNGQYIRKMSLKDFTDATLPFLEKAGLKKALKDRKQLEAMLATEQGRVKRLDEVADKISFFLQDDLEYTKKLLVWKKGKLKDLPDTLNEALSTLQALDEKNWKGINIQEALQKVVAKLGKGTGDVFWPVRVALSGQEASPGPQEIAEVIGKERTLQRIETALKKVA